MTRNQEDEMHILHNHITLGEVTVAMSHSEAKGVFEVLQEMLAKDADTIHVLKFKDSTGTAVTVQKDGSARPAEAVYRFQSYSGQVG